MPFNSPHHNDSTNADTPVPSPPPPPLPPSAIPAIKIQGCTRFSSVNEQPVAAAIEPTTPDAAVPYVEPLSLSADIRTVLQVPEPLSDGAPAISVCPAEERIAARPSALVTATTRPSGIPKRTTAFRPIVSMPSTSADAALTHADLYNEVFEDKPISKVQPSVAAPTPAIFRKCSMPIDLTTVVAAPATHSSAPFAPQTPASGHRPVAAASNATPSAAAGHFLLASKARSAATAATSNANKYLEERYKCKLCGNPFNDPRVLDCLHTFCYVCLCNAEAASAAAATTTQATTAAGGSSRRTGAQTSTVTASPASTSVAGHCDGSSELDYSGKFNGCDRDDAIERATRLCLH